MAFSTKQIRQLRARVPADRVRERQVEGRTLHYVEGWHVVAEANRIFGFDGWDRETISSQCVWQKTGAERSGASYVTRVKLTIRAGEKTVVREGLGSGEAFAPTAGQAHERAAKAAETDATKRALSTFGNRFGLSLYRDKQEPPRTSARSAAVGVSRTPDDEAGGSGRSAARTASESTATANPQSSSPTGLEASSATDGHQELQHAYRVSAPINRGSSGTVLETVRLADTPRDRVETSPGQHRQLPVTTHVLPTQRIPVDKSALPLGEPKRLRSLDHLRFVARQPCLVCGRQPAQAHHLRFAQPRALSRKVSDEFTVPLCNFHHDEVHKTGNEFQWWRARGLDPLQAAKVYWAETRDFPGASASSIEGAVAGPGALPSDTQDPKPASAAPP